MPAERANFYLLLELDPAVDDWPAIEQRLVEKKRSWARDLSMGNPKARRRAESSLALLQEIASALKDPERRRAEAEEARRQQQRDRQQQAREIDEAIALLKAGGEAVSEEQFKKLAQRFSTLFTAEEIRKRLKNAGMSIGADPSAGRQPRQGKPQIDQVTASTLQQNLQHLGDADLYAFLDLNPRSSARALCDRADEIFRDNHKAGKTDADAAARNVLVGEAKTLFQSAVEKERYDNYLAVQAMEGLKPNLEIAGADGHLSRQEIDALINQARRRQVAAEDARAFIEDYAATRKWRVGKDGGEPPAATIQLCGFCTALAPATAASCPECGQPLRLDCPRCGSKNPSANAACERCGCHLGDAPLVQGLLVQGERLAVAGDLAAALGCFDKALLYWPGWEPASQARQRWEGRSKERETAIGAIEGLLRQRRLTAARPAFDRCAQTYGRAGLEDIDRQVREGLTRAETAFRQGEQHRVKGDDEAALDCYEAALATCADFEPARRALAGSPPASPSDLRVKPMGSGFRLSWTAPGTGKGVAYRVLRQAGRLPRGLEDGELLGDIQATTVDDPAAAVGTPWCYAVFALRGGVSSQSPAHSGPHLLTAEVEDLELLAGNGDVALSWKKPPGCVRVEVWRRSKAPPAGATDGTQVPVAGNGAQDVGLVNGETYGYRVWALFVDPSSAGALVHTAGRTAVARPAAPPPPVRDLRAERHGKAVVLRWTPAPGARVQIRQTSHLPDYAPGLVLPAVHADRFGCLVPNLGDGQVQVTLTEQGRLFFVPLSLAAGTAVAGSAVEVTTLEPVTNLSGRRSSSSLFLTWEWPAGSDEVLVAWASDRYPQEPIEKRGSRARVTRREYERTGGWLLPYTEPHPYYFAVFAKAPSADLYASPARLFESAGQGITVSYEVVIKRSLLRRSVKDAWVELRSSGGDPVLPAVLLVGKAPSVPLSPKDGEVLAEVVGVRFDNGRAVVPIPASHWPGRPYVKLFFKDAGAAREIRLLPAAKERLRLA